MSQAENHKPGAGHDAQVKMHQGEIDIDAARVKRLLAEQFPDLDAGSLALVRSTGSVNAVYRLERDLYVRLPRLEKWAASLEHEWNWLPKLSPHISLKIPQPLARGKPTSWYPFPWAIYRWIEGSTYQDGLIDDERQAARDLAQFILELRSIAILGAPRGGRPPLIELDAATRSAIETSGAEVDAEAVLAVWTHSLESTPWDGKPEWIHTDLLKPNLLVEGGRLCAVIDFGGAGIGDPAADVVPAWSVFGQLGRETFRQVLDVDDDTWIRARGYALHQALLIIPYYLKTNPEFVAMAKRTVEEIRLELR
ncbi:aminoglycoside phosphotransferase family protein [uncultured Meiothermus sp.]|uniref:aminoglycoside phosphotransferase family protein n=1 Tax=uncultured Meiothermus sp. TaxID=157471 RepID=UPI00262528E9|nr:aminoglycoside phosphotransferase family protein [uncultured Meiothermus sp.]